MIASQEEDKEVGNTRNKTTLVLKKKKKNIYMPRYSFRIGFYGEPSMPGSL